jgi:hypothetical protein
MGKSGKSSNANSNKKSAGKSAAEASPPSPKTDQTSELEALRLANARLTELNASLQGVNTASVENVAKLHDRIRELEADLRWRALGPTDPSEMQPLGVTEGDDDDELAELERDDTPAPGVPGGLTECDDPNHPTERWMMSGVAFCMRCGLALSAARVEHLASHENRA